jgi:hypothetical protein
MVNGGARPPKDDLRLGDYANEFRAKRIRVAATFFGFHMKRQRAKIFSASGSLVIAAFLVL